MSAEKLLSQESSRLPATAFEQPQLGFRIQSYRLEEELTPKNAAQILHGLEQVRDSMQIASSSDMVAVPTIEIKEDVTMQVRTIGRRGQRFTKLINHPMKQGHIRSTSHNQAVTYEGTASSPHIKPEFTNARMSSPSNFMRAKSLSKQPGEIPTIQGQKITTQKQIKVQQKKQRHQKDLESATSQPQYLQAQKQVNEDLIASTTSGFNLSKYDEHPRLVPRPIKSVERKRPHHIELNLVKAQKQIYNKSGIGFAPSIIDVTPSPGTAPLSSMQALNSKLKHKSVNKSIIDRDEVSQNKIRSNMQLSDFMHAQQEATNELLKHMKDAEEMYSDRRKMNNDYDSNNYNPTSTFDKRFGHTVTDNLMPTPQNLQPKLIENFKTEEQDDAQTVLRDASPEKTIKDEQIPSMKESLQTPKDLFINSKIPRGHHTITQQFPKEGTVGGFSHVLRETQERLIQQKQQKENKSGASSANISTIQRTHSVNTSVSPAPNLNKNAAIRIQQNKAGFELVAKKKDVVVNEKMEQARWQRKHNFMSKDAIKRQSMILNSLPMLAQQESESSKPRTRQMQMRDRQPLSPGKLGSFNNQVRTQESLASSADNKVEQYQLEIATQNQVKGVNMMTSPPPFQLTQNSPVASNFDQKYDDHLKSSADTKFDERKDLGTAEGARDMFDTQFRGSRPTSNNLYQTTISNWDQQNIQIGAKSIAKEVNVSSNLYNPQMKSRTGSNFAIQEPIPQQHFTGSFSLIPQAHLHHHSQSKNNYTHFSTEHQPYFQQWGQGKPTSTAQIFKSQLQNSSLQPCSKYFERRSQSRQAGHTQILINNNKRRYKSQQRQLKGLQNLGDLSLTHLKGIKVSRLNDLGTKEDGNPLVPLNKLQQIQDQKMSAIDTGGVQTKVLAAYNAEAKAQFEAIKDFTGKQSLYNTTQSFNKRSETTTRIPLQKLVGRQSILMPDKVQQTNDYSAITTTTLVKHLKQDSRNQAIKEMMKTNSQESNADNVSVNMIRMLLNQNKFGGTRTHKTNVNHEDIQVGHHSTSKNQDISETQPTQPAAMTSFHFDTTSGLPNSQLSPICNTIQLQQRENLSRATKFDEQKRTNKSRTGYNVSNLSQRASEQNKDMADMLMEFNQQEQVTSAHGKGTSLGSYPELKGETAVAVSANRVTMDKKKSNFSVNNTSQNRIETSDENGSNNALYPVGILDVPRTPEEHANRIRDQNVAIMKEVNKKDNFDTVNVASTEQLNQNLKQKVFSHQERSNSADKHQDRTNSREPSPEPTSKPIEAKKESIEGAKKLSIHKLEIQEQANYGNGVTPLIGVTSVKIQKMNSLNKPKGKVNPNREKGLSSADQIVDQTASNGKEQNVYISSEYMNSPLKTGGVRSSIEGRQYSIGSNKKSLKKEVSQRRSTKDVIDNVQNKQSFIMQNRVIVPDPGTLLQSSVNRGEGTTRDSVHKNNDSIKAVVKQKNKLMQSQKMRSSGNSNSELPNILNIISKKATINHGKQKSRSSDRHLVQTQTQQTDNILDQMSVMNILSGQASGYHQLEPKLFPTAKHDFEKAKKRPSAVPSETDISRNEVSRNLNNSRLASRKSRDNSNYANERMVSPHPPSTAFEEEEMGFVSHKAIESRFKGNRVSRQLVELKKRQIAQRKDHLKSVDETQLQLSNHRISITNSPNDERKHRHNSVIASQAAGQSVEFKHVQSKIRAQRGSQNSSINSDLALNQANDREEARKVTIVDTTISNCINIEKSMKTSVDKVYRVLEHLIGHQDKSKEINNSITTKNSIDSMMSELSMGHLAAKRGLMKMDSIQIRQFYKDHFKYEFKKNELYQLLKEHEKAQPTTEAENKRYFLKFQSVQIVNIDCQSGLISDAEPINLPMSKMVNIFFLSKVQLQSVIAKSLIVRQENGKLKLSIDQDLLRLNTYKTTPRVIRDEFFTAPLRVNIAEQLEGTTLIKESFNIEIRMPRFEILKTVDQANNTGEISPTLFKTTMTHCLTGSQMVQIMRQQGLMGWKEIAKTLIQKRIFGLDQVQESFAKPEWIKYQRLNNQNDFTIFIDPVVATQQEMVARNIQLTLLLEPNLSLQVEYLKPIFLKLKVVNEESEVATINHEHLPGYLPPDFLLKQKAKTIARVQIPYERLPWIQQSFGNRINSGQGSFMDCLNSTVQVLMDAKKEICRLATPNWSSLEEMNVRHLSLEYFLAQKRANQAQQENLKYLNKTLTGGVKQFLSAPQKVNLKNNPRGVKKPKTALDLGQFQNETSCMSVPQTNPNQVMVQENENTDEEVKPKFILVNDEMLCSLSISPLDKVIYQRDMLPAGHQKSEESISQSQIEEYREKVPLAQIVRTLTESQA